MKWTLKDIERLGKKGLGVHVPEISKSRVIIPRQESKEIIWLHWNLKFWCEENGMTLIKEYRFDPARMWRIDFFIVEIKTGVEFEGITSDISRHTSIVGYTNDTEKYSRAAIMGIKILRYTAINYRKVLQDLKQINT